jgi:uncharacterized protein YeaO (DUF488 family)
VNRRWPCGSGGSTNRPHELLAALARDAPKGTVTLVYAAKNGFHCNAAALKEFLDARS